MSLTEAPPIEGQTDIEGNEEPVNNTPSPQLDEVRVNGTTQLGLFEAGGKQPTSSSLSLTGGKFDLMDGKAFKKGDTIVFQVVAVVDTVTLKDKTDRKLGIVTACEQQHKAYITDAQLVESS